MTIGFVNRASDGVAVPVLLQNKTRIYTNTMPGAPSSNLTTLGGLITLLDACLVNGLSTVKTLGANAVTRVGNVVNVQQASHGYVDFSVILFSGASDAAYNGLHRIVVADANNYSFQLDSTLTPPTPAAGTITTQVPSAGWSKPFSGTNKAVYRPADGPRHYLRVDDSFTTLKAKVRAYRSMTDVDTGTGIYPSTDKAAINACNWMKPAGGGYGWTVVADDKGAYVIVDTNNGQSGVSFYYFGWFKDLYNFDADANSLLTMGSYNTAYNGGAADGSTQQEFSKWMTMSHFVVNSDINANPESCSGYLAKSFDGAYDSTGVPFFFMGYAMRLDNGSGNSVFNTITNLNGNYSAMAFVGNTNNGTPPGFRGYGFVPPILMNINYQTGFNEARGYLPFLQCLSTYAVNTYAGQVHRAVERFGAVYSAYVYGSWPGSGTPSALLIPLGNWEDVL